MTLFWDPTGPLLRYELGYLEIHDLNPEHKVHWKVSRWELTKIALKALLAAVFA